MSGQTHNPAANALPGALGEAPVLAAPPAQHTVPEASVGEPESRLDEPESPSAGLSPNAAHAPAPPDRVPHGSAAPFAVLRHSHYRNMLLAQMTSNIGGWMELFGMQWLVAQKTGSLQAMGYLGAAQLFPIMFFGLVGGLVCDRVNQKRLLIMTQSLLMLVAAAVAVLAALDFPMPDWAEPLYLPIARFCHAESAPGVVVPLVFLSIINGIVVAFNMPAWQVLTPRLVPREELTAAITLNGVQFNLTRVMGPVLAGLVMAQWGTTPLFVGNALSFLLVALVATTTPDAPARGSDGSHPWVQIERAAGWVFRNRGPLAVFIAMALMSLLAAPLVRVLPLFVIDVFGVTGSEGEWAGGCLLAVQGLGAVAGFLALRHIPAWYPRHHFIPLSVFGAGLSISAFAATSTLWAGYLTMFVCGFFWIWAFNQSWAVMQHLVSDAMRGRVMALVNVAAFGATAIGNVLIGWIGEGLKDSGEVSARVATQASIAMLSVPLMCAGLFMLFRRTPEVDGLPRGSGRPDMSIREAFLARSHRPMIAGENDPRSRNLGERAANSSR